VTASDPASGGGVVSADIAVPEHERVVGFYSRVLTTGMEPLWRDDLMNNAGVPIIGIGERIEAYGHLPLQWMVHIQVADVGASVSRAVEQGGDELMHHRDEHGESQWAVLRDPNGAAFGIMPPVPYDAVAERRDSSAGRISWLDLTVPDAVATRDFYASVVGWSSREIKMEDEGEHYSDYVLSSADGRAVAGVCHARGVNRELPHAWIIYLSVGDLAESLRRVVEEGGEVVRSGDSEGELAYAVIRDPVGAHFGLVSA
jgi:predicted enzyme related to lactoylglutathione lyase